MGISKCLYNLHETLKTNCYNNIAENSKSIIYQSTMRAPWKLCKITMQNSIDLYLLFLYLKLLDKVIYRTPYIYFGFGSYLKRRCDAISMLKLRYTLFME